MRIGIILNPYGIAKPSGLSRFILKTTLEIVKQSPSDEFVIFIKGKTETPDFDGIKNVEIQIMPNSVFWKDIAYIRNKNIDVWLYNNLNMPIFFKPKKAVSIALDFGNFYGLEDTSLVRRLAVKGQRFFQHQALLSSTKIISISEATSNDITRFFSGVDESKLVVSMCGFTPPCEDGVTDRVDNIPEDFFLLVGVIKQRKNQITAVKAFIKAKEKGVNAHLVITGKGTGAYFDELSKIIKETKYRDYIHYIGYRTDKEIAYLYKKSIALVVPSIVEGFGMPVVEAMSCGTAVITSNHPALVEVGGDASIICSVESVDDFARAMLTLTDKEYRENCVKRGVEQAGKFSWTKSASVYLRVLNEVGAK